MSKTKKCPSCNGSGARASPSKGYSDCPKCDGTGTVKRGMHEQLTQEQRQTLGGVGGAAAGFAAGGPAGALVGGLAGLILSTDDDDDGVGGV